MIHPLGPRVRHWLAYGFCCLACCISSLPPCVPDSLLFRSDNGGDRRDVPIQLSRRNGATSVGKASALWDKRKREIEWSVGWLHTWLHAGEGVRQIWINVALCGFGKIVSCGCYSFVSKYREARAKTSTHFVTAFQKLNVGIFLSISYNFSWFDLSSVPYPYRRFLGEFPRVTLKVWVEKRQ